jgi:hypothetical protein
VASPLAETHIEALRRLRALTIAAVGQAWQDLPGYDRQNIDQWLEQVVPVVTTARMTSAVLTDAYLATAMGRQPFGIDVSDKVRGGTPVAEVYQRPFVTVWTALGAGARWEDAVAQGMARATSAAAMDVQLAFRASADEIGRADDGIYGFQRVADGGACAFCLEVDGAYVKTADASPLHNHCGCGLEPLTDPHPGAAYLPSGSAVRDGYAIHEHGELGAVLTAPGQDFTTAALALH